MSASSKLEATLATAPNVYSIAAQTVVALPPSTLDPAANLMRVVINGVVLTRPYDPTMEQP